MKNKHFNIEILEYLKENHKFSTKENALKHLLLINIKTEKEILEKTIENNFGDDQALFFLKNKNISKNSIDFFFSRIIFETENISRYTLALLCNENITKELYEYFLKLAKVETLEKVGFNRNPLLEILPHKKTNFELIQFFVEKKANVDNISVLDSNVIRILFTKNFKMEFVEFLKDIKIETNTKDIHHKTSVHYLLKNLNISFEIFEYFFSFYENIDYSVKSKKNINLLHFLSQREDISIGHFKLLIPKINNPLETDTNGENFLHYLLKNKNLTYELFLFVFNYFEGKLDYQYKTNSNMTYLDLFCKNKRDNTKIIEYLLSKKIDPNNEDLKNNVCLHHFICQKKKISSKSLSLIFDKIQDYSFLDCSKKSFLHLVASNQFVDFEFLNHLSKKIDNNLIDDKGKTFFFYLVEKKNFSLKHFKLLDENYNFQSKDSKYRTLLHYVCSRESIPINIIQELIIRGVDVDTLDENSKFFLINF